MEESDDGDQNGPPDLDILDIPDVEPEGTACVDRHTYVHNLNLHGKKKLSTVSLKTMKKLKMRMS